MSSASATPSSQPDFVNMLVRLTELERVSGDHAIQLQTLTQRHIPETYPRLSIFFAGVIAVTAFAGFVADILSLKTRNAIGEIKWMVPYWSSKMIKLITITD